MSVLYQFVGTGICAYLCLCMGLTFTWPSHNYDRFGSNATNLHRPMTASELSLFGSLSSIGGLICTPIIGYLLDVIGRKYCLMCFSVITVISWSLLAAFNRVEIVLFAMFVNGFGAASFLIITMFIGEICQENIRGTMTSGSLAFYGVGMLLSYMMGGILEYYLMIYICLTATVVAVLLLWLLKESPTYLMQKGLEKEAARSIAFYHNARPESKEVLYEMDAIRRALNPNFSELPLQDVSRKYSGATKYIWKNSRTQVRAVIGALTVHYSTNVHMEKIGLKEDGTYRACGEDTESMVHVLCNCDVLANKRMSLLGVSTEEEKFNPVPTSGTKDKLSLWQFVKKSPSTRRAIIVCLILVSTSIFQGLVVMQVYAISLFKEAVPIISPTLGSTLMSVVGVLTGFVVAYLTDAVGRRVLMIYSSFVGGICCAILGTQLQLQWGPHWMTAVCIYTFVVSYTCGAGTVPFVYIAEVFLPEVKSFMQTLAIEWAWLCNFIILYIFNPVVSALGLGAVFYLFSATCFLSSVFCFYFQPETKGLPVDAIQYLFAPSR